VSPNRRSLHQSQGGSQGGSNRKLRATLDHINSEGAERRHHADLIAAWGNGSGPAGAAATDVMAFDLDEIEPLLDEGGSGARPAIVEPWRPRPNRALGSTAGPRAPAAQPNSTERWARDGRRGASNGNDGRLASRSARLGGLGDTSVKVSEVGVAPWRLRGGARGCREDMGVEGKPSVGGPRRGG
jgi:hypothetical protein